MDNACGLQGARQMTPSAAKGLAGGRERRGKRQRNAWGEDAATGPEPSNAGGFKPERAGRRIPH